MSQESFGGLPLEQELHQGAAEPRCGLFVIDLASGDAAHWVRLDGMVSELYDVAVLPGVTLPALFGFKTDDIQRTISIGDPESGSGGVL